jgi:hypothetical protein
VSELDPVLQRLELEFAGAHRDPAALWADVSRGPRYRSLPKHRAHRVQWRPSESVEPQHANDGDTLLG